MIKTLENTDMPCYYILIRRYKLKRADVIILRQNLQVLLDDELQINIFSEIPENYTEGRKSGLKSAIKLIDDLLDRKE